MRLVGWILLIVLAVSSFCNQGKEDRKKIAQVGDISFYTDEFWDLYRRSHYMQSDEWSNMDRVNEFMDLVVLKNMRMIEDAKANDVDKLPEVIKDLEGMKKAMLIDRKGPLYTEKILQGLEAEEDEVKELYEKIKKEYLLKHIMLKDSLMADSVYALLKEGAEFDSLVSEYSRDPYSKKKNGEIGTFTWDNPRFSNDFKEKAFNLKPGEYSRPIELSKNYHIVKLMEVKNNEKLKSLEAEEARLKTAIKNMKLNEKIFDYIEGLKAKLALKLNEETVEAVKEAVTNSDKKRVMLNDSSLFSDQVLDMSFFSCSLGDFTVKDYIEMLEDKYPNYLAMNRKFESALNVLKEHILVQEMMYLDAIESGFDKDEKFLDKYEVNKEQVLINYMYNKNVREKIKVDQDERKKFYNTNKFSLYTLKPRISFNMIVCEEKTKAEQALNELKKTKNFKAIVKKYSTDKKSASRGGFYGTIDKHDSFGKPFWDKLKEMKEKEYSSIIENNSKFYILQKEKFFPEEVLPFEQVERNVEREVLRFLKEKYEKEYFEKLKEEYPGDINEKVLEEFIAKKEREINKIKKENNKKQSQ